MSGKIKSIILVVISITSFGNSFLCALDEKRECSLTTEEKAESKDEVVSSSNQQQNVNVVSNERSLASGKELYMRNCVTCHGKDGTGNGPLGRAIKNLPNFSGPNMKKISDQEIFDILTKGAPPMPSFRNMSEKDRWDVIYYIRTFAQKQD